MNRQLYANGGIMTVAPREKFGLGSSLKKFVRKIIPNEISAIAVKAAPFVAPFNPALAAGMAGIGGFDQTGRIGSSLKSAALTYGGGQLARYAGGAGFQGNPFSSTGGTLGGPGAFRGLEGFKGGFSSPFGTKTGFGKMLSGTKDVAAIEGVGTDNIEVISGGDFGQSGEASNMFVDTGSEAFNTNAFSNAGSAVSNAGSAVSKTATQASDGIFKNYFNVLKSGDMGAIGNATMDMGGKALKAVFTNPITNAAGEVTGSTLDKTALLAAIVAVPSYMEAKALADEAGLTDEEFNEDLYNSEKAVYMSKYQENLPYESFGITAAKNGGRIGFESGSSPIRDMAMEMNSGRGPITKMDYISLYEMAGYGEDVATSLGTEHYKTGRSQDSKTAGLKDGGRIGFRSGTIILGEDELSEMGGEQGLKLKLLAEKFMDEGMSESDAYEKAADSLYAKGGRVNRAFGSPKDKTMFEELNVDTIYRPDDKPPVLEETLEDDKMVSLNNSRLTQLMLALEEAEAKNDMDMIIQIKFDIDKEMKKYAKGGRVNRMFGSPEKGEGITTIDVDMEMEEEPKNDDMKMAYSDVIFNRREKSALFRSLGDPRIQQTTKSFKDLDRILKNPGMFPEDEFMLKEYLKLKGFKNGGRIGFEIGGLGALGGAMEKESGYITKKSDTSETDTINRIYEEKGNDGLQAYLERNPDLKDKYIIVESYGGELSIMENKLHPDFLDTSNIIMLTGDGEGNMIEMKSDKVEEKAKGGIMGMEVPVRKNQGGVSELDYRDTGGFVPIGVKERADDVPAMLSKNEFVFTADAVRNAGDGNINKGAQKMYNMMKNLENGGALA